MANVHGLELDIVNDEEVNSLVIRMLEMVKTKDVMFCCLSDSVISDLVFKDFIDIDLEDQTIKGTSLTNKGWKRLYEHGS